MLPACSVSVLGQAVKVQHKMQWAEVVTGMHRACSISRGMVSQSWGMRMSFLALGNGLVSSQTLSKLAVSLELEAGLAFFPLHRANS
jgi:hypothetical protein